MILYVFYTHVYIIKDTDLHEYGNDDKSIGTFSGLRVVGVQLMVVMDQLNLERGDDSRTPSALNFHNTGHFSFK